MKVQLGNSRPQNLTLGRGPWTNPKNHLSQASGSKPTPKPPHEPKSPGELATEEALLLELVNKDRSQAGLKPLKSDFRLVQTARAKSMDMRDQGYFGHISPRLGTPFDQMRAAGISYRIAGENIAGAPSANAAHRALMQSPGHRANILSRDFTHIGIGMAKGGPYGIYFTQQFIG